MTAIRARLREWWDGLNSGDQCPVDWTRPYGIGYFTWYCQKSLGHFGGSSLWPLTAMGR